MINRRIALGIIGASTMGASGVALAKETRHFNGKALLADKIKQNGKHKIHKAGNADVYAEVSNGKVVGVSAAGMQVKKVKTTQKLADTSSPGLILASMELAQTQVYYYGYYVYDPVYDYYYWFTSDVVIVDASWAPYP